MSKQLNGLLRTQQPLTASLARSKVGGLDDLLRCEADGKITAPLHSLIAGPSQFFLAVFERDG
ncbi:hypothetical protein ATY78_01280 [Rhizobium sp. R635]|nr:hypothetical protein ATY78_01280 [Rhizobium sp. R635]